jgi:predicted esterase
MVSSAEALAQFRLSELLTTADKRTLRVRAEEHVKLRNDAAAVLLLEQWLQAAPADGEAAWILGTAYARLGRFSEASLAFQLAIANGFGDVDLQLQSADLAPFRQRKEFDDVANALREQKLQSRNVQTITIPQTRLGRYKVVLPDGFNPLLQYRIVLLIHGNGHSADVMLQWARSLGLKDHVLVCADAPYVKVKEVIASAKERYSAAGEGLGIPDTSAGTVVTLSAEWYHGVLEDARARFSGRVMKPLVIGFSQGGFYAHVLATRYPGSVAGIASICGSMYSHGLVLERYGRLRQYGVDVFVSHGTKDDVVPFQTSELIVAALTREGVRHTFLPFKGGHWPTEEVEQQIRSWVRDHP